MNSELTKVFFKRSQYLYRFSLGSGSKFAKFEYLYSYGVRFFEIWIPLSNTMGIKGIKSHIA